MKSVQMGGGVQFDSLWHQILHGLRALKAEILHENFKSEVIDLHFNFHEFRKYGKIPFFHFNSIILS